MTAESLPWWRQWRLAALVESWLLRLPLDGPADREWIGRAACNGLPPGLFFDEDAVGDALEVCWACPVRVECRQAAFVDERRLPLADICGVRAGLTEGQRRQFFRAHPFLREMTVKHPRRAS